MCRFLLLQVYAYICIADGDPVTKRENVGILFNRFNPATCLCLSQTRSVISNVIYRGLFYV